MPSISIRCWEKDTLMGQPEITATAAVQPNPREATALSEQTAVQISALAGTAVQITVAAGTA